MDIFQDISDRILSLVNDDEVEDVKNLDDPLGSVPVPDMASKKDPPQRPIAPRFSARGKSGGAEMSFHFVKSLDDEDEDELSFFTKPEPAPKKTEVKPKESETNAVKSIIERITDSGNDETEKNDKNTKRQNLLRDFKEKIKDLDALRKRDSPPKESSDSVFSKDKTRLNDSPPRELNFDAKEKKERSSSDTAVTQDIDADLDVEKLVEKTHVRHSSIGRSNTFNDFDSEPVEDFFGSVNQVSTRARSSSGHEGQLSAGISSVLKRPGGPRSGSTQPVMLSKILKLHGNEDSDVEFFEPNENKESSPESNLENTTSPSDLKMHGSSSMSDLRNRFPETKAENFISRKDISFTEPKKETPRTMSKTKIVVPSIVIFLYLIIPWPPYLSGLLMGLILSSLGISFYFWLFRPPTPREAVKLADLADLPPMLIPEIKGIPRP